jgi:hypothetical protein
MSIEHQNSSRTMAQDFEMTLFQESEANLSFVGNWKKIGQDVEAGIIRIRTGNTSFFGLSAELLGASPHDGVVVGEHHYRSFNLWRYPPHHV